MLQFVHHSIYFTGSSCEFVDKFRLDYYRNLLNAENPKQVINYVLKYT